MQDNFDGFMRSTITRNFFRGMVGRQMFCPACRGILDYRRSVLFNTHVVCCKCYDGTRAKVAAEKGADYVDSLEARMAERLDFVDGRQWAKGKR